VLLLRLDTRSVTNLSKWIWVLLTFGKFLLPSPRNSLEGQLNLFRSTDCKALLTSSGYNVSPQLVSDSNLTPTFIPSLASLLAKGHVTHYPFTKSYEEANNDPFIVLHTSGSTGLPKPILIKHSWTSAMDAFNLLGELDGYNSLWWKFRNRRVFIGLPPFHVSEIPDSSIVHLLKSY
jgi:hypothetical protein